MDRRTARFPGVVVAFGLLVGCAGASRAPGSVSVAGEGAAGTTAIHSVGELNALARVIKSGMRTAMLAGDGLTVRDFVQDLQQSGSGVSVALFSASGERVYAPAAPPPPRESLPPAVREVLATGLPAKPTGGSGGATSFALVNEDRCKGCHPAGNLRAVMTLELAKQAPAVPAEALIPFGRVVEAAFDAMMTLGKSHEADAFINALPKEVPGIKTAAVFSRDGKPSLGDGFMEVPAEVAKRAVTPTKAFAHDLASSTLIAVPLPNAPRCLSCHKPSEMRGAIVLELDHKLGREEAAKFLLTSSLKHVMLTGLGRLTKKFLNDAASSGLFATVTVHDSEGRLFHDINARPVPPAAIAEALRTGQSSVRHEGGQLTVVLPVSNEDKCRRCHDEPGGVRAVIAVSSGRADSNVAQAPAAFAKALKR
jgi:hypothetical protein